MPPGSTRTTDSEASTRVELIHLFQRSREMEPERWR